MSKQGAARRLDDTEAQAVGRHIRISPQKLNLVADLTFSQKRIAGVVKKVLQSAIANAENNHQLDVDRLVVKEATVGKGLVMKRFSPRARGRVGTIRKPFSHLTIIVREREETA